MRRLLPLLLLLAACESSDSSGSDAGLPAPDAAATASDAGAPALLDASTSLPSPDAGVDAGTIPGKDAGMPPDAALAGGVPCVLNADCKADERCECDEVNGCFCMIGARGTGKAGVDSCTDGNDCESSLCVEGNPSGSYYCSGECTANGADGGCGPNLPRCVYVSFIGFICARAL